MSPGLLIIAGVVGLIIFGFLTFKNMGSGFSRSVAWVNGESEDPGFGKTMGSHFLFGILASLSGALAVFGALWFLILQLKG